MSNYHHGEQQIQKRAGVTLQADQLAGMVQPYLTQPAAYFLLAQQLSVLTTSDADKNIWVSALVGEPGFIYPLSGEKIVIDAHTLPKNDILWGNLTAEEARPTGMLAIDFARRRRLRVNGKARLDDEFIVLDLEQTYSNCPKYIQKRTLENRPDLEKILSANGTSDKNLSPEDIGRITGSDTFFIGTCAEGGGADTSHRGGRPGFVEVLGNGKIRFPDYSGNNMFNTLGNLAVNPHLGLLFVDFRSGDSLQVTGRAVEFEPFRWHNGEKQGHIDVEIDGVRRSAGGALGHWDFEEYSPFNPQ